MRAVLSGLAWLVIAAGVAGCGELPRDSAGGGRVSVVAAENVWGSLAAQLGGDRVSVHSIINGPGVDPHAYEPNSTDAIALAGAKLAVVNGIGYDSWASRLLAADGGAVQVLDVGHLLGLSEGANPHQWYSPGAVRRVIVRITSVLCRIDPRDCAYFQRRRSYVEHTALAEYGALIAEIRRRYAGVPVGYSESIFTPLGRALGLRLLTPAGFADAVAEGAEVTAADVQTVEAQVKQHLIKVWILNRQNASPDVQRVGALARAAGIPMTTITETLDPATATFQRWQVAELRSLQAALHRATGR